MTVDFLLREGMKCVVIFLVQITMMQAQNVEFITRVDRDSVPLGQPFKVEFQLKNSQGAFNGPDLSDFQIMGGPNYMSSYTMINGESNMELTYSYILEGKEEGTFIIGPASVKTSKDLLESDPVEITIYFDPEHPTQEPEKKEQPIPTKRKKAIRI